MFPRFHVAQFPRTCTPFCLFRSAEPIASSTCCVGSRPSQLSSQDVFKHGADCVGSRTVLSEGRDPTGSDRESVNSGASAQGMRHTVAAVGLKQPTSKNHQGPKTRI